MLTLRNPALMILALSLGALSLALIAQYGFDLAPCQLCLYQRVPFCLAALLAAASLQFPVLRPYRTLVLAGCALLFLGNSGLALFHAGVEQHWWAGPASCTGGSGGAKTISDLMAQLSKQPKIPSCDSIAWSLFGISMAGYNVLASIALALYAAGAARGLWGTR